MTTCGHLDQIRDVTPEANEFEIRPEPDRLPGLDFVRLDERKKAKSRLHLDFRPDDQDAEMARLVAHGAQHVDIGQGDQSWVVWRCHRAG